MTHFITDFIVNKSNFEFDDFKVLAYSQFNYPIFCIHALIEDSSPDPLEKLDKSIIDLLIPNRSLADVEIILGLPLRIIESRVNELVNLKYLYIDDGSHHLSAKGQDVFLEGKQEICRRKTYDFYIDGITLSPLSKYFYNKWTYQYFIIEKEPSFYIDYEGNISPNDLFLPDLSHTPPSLESVKQQIFEISYGNRESCRIPQGIIDIIKISHTKIIYPVLIAHLNDNNGRKANFVFNGYQNIYKQSEDFEVFNKNLKQKIKNLSVELISLKRTDETIAFYFNNNWNEIDRYGENNPLIFGSEEDLAKALNSFYDLELTMDNIDVSLNSITIIIDYHLFRKSSKKLTILSNLKRKSDYVWPKGSVMCLFLEFYTKDRYLSDLIEINELLNQYCGVAELDRILKEFNYSKRQVLIDLQRFEALESLNINEHFISKFV